MRTLSFLFIALLLIQFTTFAQDGWFWQNPLPQGNSLNSVDFVDELTGWAIGYYGTIIKTTDGGTTWQSQTDSIGSELKSVSFVDFQNGMAVGWRGTILRTTDGGTNLVSKAGQIAFCVVSASLIQISLQPWVLTERS